MQLNAVAAEGQIRIYLGTDGPKYGRIVKPFCLLWEGLCVFFIGHSIVFFPWFTLSFAGFTI